MVNTVEISSCMLPVGLVINFVTVGLATVIFGGKATTEGANYSYVQPDDQTFAVWSVIYILHLLLVLSQFCWTEKKHPGIKSARGWLFVNYVTNGLWLVVNGAANHGFSYWLAVVVLFVNLFALAQCYVVLGVDYTVQRSWTTKLTLYAPVSCNLAWVVLAAILNLTNTLYDPAYSSKVAIGGPDFAIAIVGLATVLAGYLAVTRLDFGYLAVTIWAFLGIHRNQLASGSGPLDGSKELDEMAIGSSVALVIALVFGLTLHTCGNNQTNQNDERDETIKSVQGYQTLLPRSS